MTEQEALVTKVILLYNRLKRSASDLGYESFDNIVFDNGDLNLKKDDFPKIPDDFLVCQRITHTLYRPFNPDGDQQPSFRSIRRIVHCYKAICNNRFNGESSINTEIVSLIIQCMENHISFCSEIGCQPFEDHSDHIEAVVMKECKY